MTNIFTKKTTKSGAVQYRNVTENIIVSSKDLDPVLLARLDAAEEGAKIPESADIDTAGAEPVVIKDGVKTRKITLTRPLLVNGFVYRNGVEIEVPADQADDLIRIDREHGEYEANLVKSRDGTRKSDVRPQDIQ